MDNHTSQNLAVAKPSLKEILGFSYACPLSLCLSYPYIDIQFKLKLVVRSVFRDWCET